MTSNLQQSLSGLYEIAKNLNQKIISASVSDYTAFEVFVTDTEIPSGTLYKDVPEEIKMYVPDSYLNEYLECTISAGLDITMDVRDGTGKDSNVIVDFGDNSTLSIHDQSVTFNGDDTYTFTHTYEEPGKYIVKILGNTYYNFHSGSAAVGGSSSKSITGRCCRCLEEDLPLAECVKSLVGSFSLNPALFRINLLDDGKIFRRLSNITNFQYMFMRDYNLLQVKGFKKEKFASFYKPEWARDAVGIFAECYNLRTCDFKAIQSNNYTSIFDSPKLIAAVQDLLPLNFKENRINISKMFGMCSSLTGTVPANILWEDPEYKPIYTNGTLTGFDSTSKFYWAAIDATPFKNTSETIRAQVPTSWGGTNEEIEAKLQAGYWQQSSDGEFEIKFNELLEYVNQQIQILKDQILN